MPFIILAIIAGVVISVISAKKKAAAAASAQNGQKRVIDDVTGSVPASGMPAQRVSPTAATDSAQRQQELKRRLLENSERLKLERETLQKAGRPIASHSEEDCGGGSIHDGYHEGVTQFPNGRPPAVAGKLGNRLADEDDQLLREQIASENAKRAMAKIAKLPPLAQGVVWGELLGKPKSETA